jgi:serine/threonine protein kinase
MSSVRELEREMETLQKLRHPNIVQYYGIERTSKYINIFLEWVPGGSIRDLLNKFGALRFDTTGLPCSSAASCASMPCVMLADIPASRISPAPERA